MLRSTICTGLAAISFALTSASTVARAPPASEVADAGQRGGDLDVGRMAVRFADLALSHAAGVKVLYWRIGAAADSVCSSLRGPPGLATQLAVRTCLTSIVCGAASATVSVVWLRVESDEQS